LLLFQLTHGVASLTVINCQIIDVKRYFFREQAVV
jgi:hypothetical protein